MNKIYMVGAHSRGRTAAHYICYLNPEVSIEAYLYDNDEVNETSIDGVSVIHFDENTKLNTEYPVYIGTRGIFHPSIIQKLEQIGMQDIRPITVELDLQLRNEYLKKYYASVGREFIKINDLPVTDRVNEDTDNQAAEFETTVYVAKSIFDKQLKDSYELQDYEREIQVGAALTEERLAEDIIVDNVGENISVRNKQFCELTALYWIWKNATEDVVGLVHYRRHFTMPVDWQKRMHSADVDVILPVPLYVAPSLDGNFRSRHDETDWDYMLQCLKERDTSDYESAVSFFAGGLYSPCNMLIVRKEVLDDLCEWMFPILFAVAEHGGQKEDTYLNRYPGFISERLISYFFDKNRDKYKVVYGDKNFLQ